MLVYAKSGLIGVLAPQANATAEPELSILAPPGHGLVSARLTSDKPTVEARLADYLDSIETTLDRFANAPLSAVLFACTGASYLRDPALEAEQVRQISARRGYPFITAADAVRDAVVALGAQRVGLVSPYSGPLHEACLAYWPSRGVPVARTVQVGGDDAAFHPIYALDADRSAGGAAALAADVDLIVMLGTGLATLPTLLDMAGGPVATVSPNLCLMWRAVSAIGEVAPSADNLRPWIAGEGWGERLRARLG